ncbi:MAG: 3-phosphoshikimate 1-carboxyvinyltransferase [Alphaproteobacteria bacterium]|nr:3-phosphoshikimate 1-carboxyvinyltransferase [Alphaproteobacteria bacterium]
MAVSAQPSQRLSGTIAAPGDKSISHRALLLGASAVGETTIRGLLEGHDVLATAGALRAMGISIEREGSGLWRVVGRGVGGLREAATALDLGNSGTGARLLMGLVATQPITSIFIGDESLSRRPMSRVLDPLRQMGATVGARGGDRLPVTMTGAAAPLPIAYELPVPSAQVKSAILLAGLNTPGETVVVEPTPTRDHTERMLAYFGADLKTETAEDGGRWTTLFGQPELAANEVTVPADPSSAAFPTVAALITPESAIRITGVGVNPLRTGLYQTLIEMGADIEFTNERTLAGEPVADLLVASSAMHGVDVPPRRAASMIDEYPVLAVAAACARGTSTFRGIGELRVKESDRIAAIATGLAACGIATEVAPDSLTIEGCGGPPPGDGVVESRLDHRIAMAFLVLGLGAAAAVAIDDADPIATSYPDFTAHLKSLGARIGGSEAP